MKKLFWCAAAVLLIVSVAYGQVYWLTSDVMLAASAAVLAAVIVAVGTTITFAITLAAVAAAFIFFLVGIEAIPITDIVVIAIVVDAAGAIIATVHGLDYANTERLSRLRVLALLAFEAGALGGWELLMPRSLPLAVLALAAGIILMAASAFVGVSEQENSEAPRPA